MWTLWSCFTLGRSVPEKQVRGWQEGGQGVLCPLLAWPGLRATTRIHSGSEHRALITVAHVIQVWRLCLPAKAHDVRNQLRNQAGGPHNLSAVITKAQGDPELLVSVTSVYYPD